MGPNLAFSKHADVAVIGNSVKLRKDMTAKNWLSTLLLTMQIAEGFSAFTIVCFCSWQNIKSGKMNFPVNIFSYLPKMVWNLAYHCYNAKNKNAGNNMNIVKYSINKLKII